MGINKQWPVDRCEPWGIKNDYTWKEIGVIFRMIDDYEIGLMIETGVHSGDIAAWMLLKGLIDENFHYVGITLELERVNVNIRGLLSGVTQSFIAPGLAYSQAILDRTGKFINNSNKPVLVFCNGKDQEKEFLAYTQVLRPGDAILVAGFPATFPLRHFQKLINEEKLKRVLIDWTLGTRFIAGIML